MALMLYAQHEFLGDSATFVYVAGLDLYCIHMAKFRILLADDSLAMRRALQDLLCRESDHWIVCGEAADGQAAVQKVGELLPDVLLLDLSLPVVPGLKVAQIVKQDHPQVRVIIMSAQDASTMSVLGKAAGTPYAIPKSQLTETLLPLLSSLRTELEKGGDCQLDARIQ
jgi:DNA-binding NarL/FixJ family response regulator